ncbi:MAG: replication-relaxation family protein [Devosia sp.]|nr:replication-relaxation family protein [Devosia sp.]
MTEVTTTPARRPRFRRASETPAFRLTEDDVDIVRQLARYRFLRSSHIAALVGRSHDRTNDRLLNLFHSGFVDRPRAQLDFYPTSGSAPMVYALADRGAHLLIERDGIAFANVEWSRKNREVGRPFIEHQLEIVDFTIAVQLASFGREDMKFISPEELVQEFPDQRLPRGNPFKLSTQVSEQRVLHEVGLIPDFVFGLRFPDGSRRCFMVEIDRGTMPILRSDIGQTSFARKMRSYLSAHAAKLHERKFGWKTFRVLTVTTDEFRIRSMQQAAADIRIPHSLGAPLFLFATREQLAGVDPLSHLWRDGTDKAVALI